MRHTEPASRDTWATFVAAAREAAMLSKTELARRLGVDRYTVHRWETSRFRPKGVDEVVTFARVLNIDLDEALAAAGFRPMVEAPREPTREPDPELDRIRESHLPPEVKKRLIVQVLQRRTREQQARMEDLEVMIRNMGG